MTKFSFQINGRIERSELKDIDDVMRFLSSQLTAPGGAEITGGYYMEGGRKET